VLIADLPAGEAPPVERTGLEVVLFAEPEVTAVRTPSAGPDAIVYGGELLVVGSGFGGDGVRLLIGGADLPLPPGAAADGRILAMLDGGGVRAGVQPLQVVTAAGFRSPAANVLLRPAVRDATLANGALTVELAPEVGADQSAHILLNLTSASPPGVQTEFTLEVGPQSTPTSLTASTTGVPAGVYTVRVRVDGAESLPGLDPLTRRYDQPAITVPQTSGPP
jgi:hypothetical protein